MKKTETEKAFNELKEDGLLNKEHINSIFLADMPGYTMEGPAYRKYIISIIRQNISNPRVAGRVYDKFNVFI